MILRGCWHSIVLNMHAPCEDKSDDAKNSFHEVQGYVFDQFPRYDIKNFLHDFNGKVGREDSFRPTVANDSCHEISINNTVMLVNFATCKTWSSKLPCSLIVT
jgi:hypothetical protein